MDASCSNLGPCKRYKPFIIRNRHQLMAARDSMLLQPQHTVMCLYFPRSVATYDVLTFRCFAQRYGQLLLR
ncbi:hypothetical protein P8452_63367 [Trifolium repens]|nr:hypothetical protein P8452_63367 [Trifolium repens]